MNRGKWYWAIFLALIVLVVGEYFSGFLTLLFLQNGITLKNEILLGTLRIPLPTEIHGVVVAILLVGALLLDANFRRRALRAT